MEIIIGFGIVSVILLTGIKICQEYQRGVVFRLGRFSTVKGPGLYYLIPFLDRQQKVDLRTRTVDLEQQETITKDSVTIKVNAVLWFRVTDPEKAIIKVANYTQAVYQFSVTALRNIIGQHQLDEVLRERVEINRKLQLVVDEATEPWGIQIEMVEMKDVEIPISMQRAMAREAEAVREKRARIIKAEAESEAAQKLSDSARVLAETPMALELRRMQMLTEIGVENNTTTVIMLPSEIIDMAKGLNNVATKSQ